MVAACRAMPLKMTLALAVIFLHKRQLRIRARMGFYNGEKPKVATTKQQSSLFTRKIEKRETFYWLKILF